MASRFKRMECPRCRYATRHEKLGDAWWCEACYHQTPIAKRAAREIQSLTVGRTEGLDVEEAFARGEALGREIGASPAQTKALANLLAGVVREAQRDRTSRVDIDEVRILPASGGAFLVAVHGAADESLRHKSGLVYVERHYMAVIGSRGHVSYRDRDGNEQSFLFGYYLA